MKPAFFVDIVQFNVHAHDDGVTIRRKALASVRFRCGETMARKDVRNVPGSGARWIAALSTTHALSH